MAKRAQLIGQRFGRLVVIGAAPNDPRGGAVWNCICDCGNDHQTSSSYLLKGRVTSCGCRHSDELRARKLTHGLSKTSEYYTWRAMLDRCTNPESSDYKDYGGRGIAVCDRWANDFLAFLSDMGKRPKPELTLERINNDLGYSPENCRWAHEV